MKRFRRVLAALLTCALSTAALTTASFASDGLSTTGTLASSAATVVLQINHHGQGVCTLAASGTLSGTVQIEGSPDGTNWFAVDAWPFSSSTGSTVHSFTSLPVHYTSSCAGLSYYRLRVSSYASGSAAVTLTAEDGNAVPPSAGGGGGGTVTQGTPATSSGAWPIKVVDSAGTNVAAVSSGGALAIQGVSAGVPVQGYLNRFTSTLTTTPLGSSAVYDSSWMDNSTTPVLRVNVQSFSDKASAASGFIVQQSNDNTNANLTNTAASATCVASTLCTINANVSQRYWRIQYTNTNSAQTSFELALASDQVIGANVDTLGNYTTNQTLWNSVALGSPSANGTFGTGNILSTQNNIQEIAAAAVTTSTGISGQHIYPANQSGGGCAGINLSSGTVITKVQLAPVTLTASEATTQVIALVASKYVHLCAISVSGVLTTAGAINVLTGTGTNCGTSTATLMTWQAPATTNGFFYAQGDGNHGLIDSLTAGAICVSTGAFVATSGPTLNITYAQY